MTFEVGDKVRVVKGSIKVYGREGKVYKIDIGDYPIRVVFPRFMSFAESELEKVEDGSVK